MSTIPAQKALESVNAELERQAHQKATDIIKGIVARQMVINKATEEIAELKKQLAAVKVDLVEAGTIGL
jgi:hypothetical protein